MNSTQMKLRIESSEKSKEMKVEEFRRIACCVEGSMCNLEDGDKVRILSAGCIECNGSYYRCRARVVTAKDERLVNQFLWVSVFIGMKIGTGRILIVDGGFTIVHGQKVVNFRTLYK